MEIVNGAKDLETPLDFRFNEVFGGIGILPSKIDLNFTTVQNQGILRNPSTAYACTCFSVSHATNIENYIETSNLLTSGEEVWAKALTRGATLTEGWYVKLAIDLIKEMGYIDGYTKVIGLEEIKQALVKNQVVCTGTNQIDWNKTTANQDKIAQKGDSYGHAFCIIGYDDSEGLFKLRNSYGDKYQDAGHFYLRYEDIGLLYTTFALVDHANSELLLSYKLKMQQENIDKAISLGLTSGSNPDKPLIRKDAFAMLGALAKLIEAKTGSLK